MFVNLRLSQQAMSRGKAIKLLGLVITGLILILNGFVCVKVAKLEDVLK